jgi:hypothetical protein
MDEITYTVNSHEYYLFLDVFSYKLCAGNENKNNVDEISNLEHAIRSHNFVKQNSRPQQYIYGTSHNAKLVSSFTSSLSSKFEFACQYRLHKYMSFSGYQNLETK